MKVLLVGVGGLGGEYLHTLMRCPNMVNELCIVDHDTVSRHTISRHPLFTSPELVGQSKAELASLLAKPHFSAVTFHSTRIQQFDLSLFTRFDTVVCAVDCVDTRRFVNAACVQSKAVRLLVEGGVEGWMGHVRGVRVGSAPCLECHIDFYYAGVVDVKPVCQEPVMPTDNVVVTAPFVNAMIGGLMVSMTVTGDVKYILYNAKTSYLATIPLSPNPDCVICPLGGKHLED